MSKAYLVLDDGSVFEGKSAGLIGTTTGEICFNTSMTGYQEVFTDPSYYGQILVSTNVHIGNYGTADRDNESDSVKISGLVCRNFSEKFSRTMADDSLQEYFEKNKIVAISDVDTRAIVKKIRTEGAMNAIISSEDLDPESLKRKLKEVPSMEGLELASHVSTKKPYYRGEESAPIKIGVLDVGIKKSILDNFDNRGCYLKVFPAKTSYEEIMEWKPNGFFISNGPGDPAAMPYAVETTKKFLDSNVPTFGICLGHQILAQAVGVSTYKMHHGHRGSNHPVKNLETGKCEITCQNHGFGVSPEQVKTSDRLEITHYNLNDDTIEGVRVKDKPAFSVQYHPEASPGPHDSRYLFDQFINLIKETNP